ncbi:DUF3857 domain-containing protein [Labilibacter sediminis]|nr:DUF3857 domain-containing protein [Labilibacter sediminis]
MRITSLYFMIILCISTLHSQNNCEILEYNTSIVFNGSKLEKNIEYTIQINNGAGTEHAEITIPFTEKNKIRNLEASISDIFGNEIRSLKKKEIEITTPWHSFEFHTDDRLLTFKLIHNRFPYIVKYSYSQNHDNYISLAHWSPAIDDELSIKKAQLNLRIPEGTPINIYQQNVDSAQVNTIDGVTSYQWKKENYTCPEEKGTFAPKLPEVMPYVVVMPHEFNYGVKGGSTTWKEYGNWTFKLNEGLDQLTDSEKIKVHKLTDSLHSDTEKIKALYHYLQDNTRYIYVGLGIGGFQSHPANYVCDNRYGDCKALTNYMMALLKEVGIKSHWTTIYRGFKPIKIIPDFPTTQFNHVILCVPQSNDTIWLECTDKTSPFNYIGSSNQNRLALINKTNDSHLVKTPALSMQNSLEEYVIDIQINEMGNASFKADGILNGNEFDNIRQFNDELKVSDKQKYIDRLRLLHGADISKFDIKRTHRDSLFLRIDLEGTLNHITERIGKKTILFPVKPISYNINKVEDRKLPVFVSQPINKKDSIIYNLNNSILDISGKKQYELSSKFGYYKRQTYIHEDKLIVSRTFQLKQGRYPLDTYPDFYEFLNKILIIDNQKTIISY